MNEIILDPQPALWDEYVTASPQGFFSHLYGWTTTLAAVYDLHPFLLAAVRNGRLTGVVPLVLFDPPGKEKRLISLPYTDAAGIIADDDQTAIKLFQAALDLAVDLDVHHLELRQAHERLALPSSRDREFTHNPYSFKTGLVRDLPPSSEELWHQLNAKVRNQVRKAKNCACRMEKGGEELLESFYQVFSENMRDLGSPVHSVELFTGMVKKCESRVFVVSIEGKAAAASILFIKGATLFNPWASSIKRFRPRCPNMMLYWAMLAFGADTGYTRFDFGRSTPGAPTCRFKQQWGARKESLVWHVFSRKGFQWDPRQESLVDEAWKAQDLEASRRQGPLIRQWISL